MIATTCPHCGARRTVTADKKRMHFECDTIYFRANSYERGYSCFERQLDAQAAEIERLRGALTDMLEGWRFIYEEHGYLYGVGGERCENNAIAALKRKKVK